jgi:hypothetical protein
VSAFSVDDVFPPERLPVAWLLLAFILTSLLTRIITRRIRAASDQPDAGIDTGTQAAIEPGARAGPENAGRGVLRDIHVGGVHVHHQVWGILLSLLAALLLVAYQPGGIALDIIAGVLGAGAALALDEFAMWLHLRDVYWATEGRKSISALMTACAICLVLVLGADPLNISRAPDIGARITVAAIAAVNLLLSIVCLLKGKLPVALIGIFMPVVAYAGAWRLAKPGSWWARRRYDPGSRKDRRSRRRFGPRYQRRWERIRDLIGGTPAGTQQALGVDGTGRAAEPDR